MCAGMYVSVVLVYTFEYCIILFGRGTCTDIKQNVSPVEKYYNGYNLYCSKFQKLVPDSINLQNGF